MRSPFYRQPLEKGYKDSDGEEHWVEDLELID